jgi:hypothetical protein
MPHMPAALTTISHSIADSVPSVPIVCTRVQRRPSTSIFTTLVCSQIVAPRMRAPRAIAWVTLDGSM